MALQQVLQTVRPRKSLQIQLMSDLHLEVGQQYLTFRISPTAPYLVLAGDIGQLSNYELYLSFLRLQCDQFLRVFLVLGNHEFFGVSHDEGVHLADCLEKEPSLSGRLLVLHRRRYDFEESSDITVVGCTLWSQIQPEAREIVESKVKDFRRIQDWSVAKHNAEHDKDVDWLQKQIQMIRKEPNGLHRRIVVITHHAPSLRQTSKPSDTENPWTSAFASDLIGAKNVPSLTDVQWWIFGHTHYSTYFMSNGVKVISNQRGYSLPGKADNAAPNPKRRLFSSNLIASVIAFVAPRTQKQNKFNVTKTIHV